MTTNYGQQVYSQGSGTASTTLLDAVRLPRIPTISDVGYPLGKFWVDTTTNAVWYLASQSSGSGILQANWVNVSAGSMAAGVSTIDGIAPDGSGNFTISSLDGSVTITPEANGIDLSVGSSPTKYDGNTGGDVTPNISNQLFILGNNSTGINVIGNSPLNTLTISSFQATTIQEGTVTLATNAQAIAGVDAVNAVTSAALSAKLGIQTVHSLAVFEGTSSALTALGVATNGQLPIGSTGADPVLANITSTGGTITITNGPGTINLDVAASSHDVETLTGNSGGAISPIAGNINTIGTGNITIAGTGSTLTTQLTGLTNHSVQVGAGTSNLTQLTVGTDGQVLIGATAADPAFATLTSSDSSIAFTTGSNTLSLQVAGGSTTIKTITGNTGGAESPSSGNFNILGTGSITVAGSANTETVQLTGLTNHAIQIGAGTATLTQLSAGTTGQVLQTNTGADPTWSTATYPSTTTINQILYSSAANTVTGLATANNGVLITSATGVPSLLAAGTTGQILTATTGSPASWAAPVASSITIAGNTGTTTGNSFTITTGASNTQGTSKFTMSSGTLTHTFTDASTNTGLGLSVLSSASFTGANNTAFGANAMKAATTAGQSVAIGSGALALATTPQNNTAVGFVALASNVAGANSTAVGSNALEQATGSQNTAVGSFAGMGILSGGQNCLFGYFCGSKITTGASNTGAGFNTLLNVLTGSSNLALGTTAGNSYTTSESNNIMLNSVGVIGESNVLRIGAATGTGALQLAKAFICGIDGVNVGSVATVVTETSNQLGTAVITAGSGISVTAGANTITIAATSTGGITTINGDSGSITGSTVTIKTGNSTQNCGASVLFVNSGTTSTLDVTDASHNTIIGSGAGNASLSGNLNTGVGGSCLSGLTSGVSNSALGYGSLTSVQSGADNVGIGNSSLSQLTSGNSNTCIGLQSGSNYTTSESNNILVGFQVKGTVGESAVIRIGNSNQTTCFIAGIAGVSVSNLNIVTINTATGQLGSQSAAGTAPTIQKFTTGSGTYTTPTSPAPLYIRVVLVGPGGGGSAQSTNDGSAGSAATTFGTTLLSGGAGSGGTIANTGGAGGTASLGAAIGIAINGGTGQPGPNLVFGNGGIGASSYFGGAGAGGYSNLAGGNATTNSGSGGGGAGAPNAAGGGGQGGGAGGFVDAIITSPSATYSYVVGAGGAGGAAGGVVGGNGAAGQIVVYEYYQ